MTKFLCKTGHIEVFEIKYNVMNIKKNIEFAKDRLPKGYVFTYNDFITELISNQAVRIILNRVDDLGLYSKILTKLNRIQDKNYLNLSILSKYRYI